ncbi:MAG: hypothetical protein IPP17_13925 [Bacteroidetes bacterium]|jgi:hypothetical protein|nr:hypothetical protein [Bacteroidota bacterium]
MKKFVFALLLLIGSQLQAQTGKDEALEALGGSGGLLLYDTYLVIGEAADAFTKDTYTAEEVEKIVQEQIGGIETVQGQYDALLATKFLSDPADSKFLRELTDAFDLVVAEGKALIEYVHSGSDTDAGLYEDNRSAAWAEISRLLGFEEE